MTDAQITPEAVERVTNNLRSRSLKSDCGEAADMIDALAQQNTALQKALADEQNHSDRLAEHVEWLLQETETNRGDEPLPNHGDRSWNEINSYWIANEDAAQEALTAHAKRKEQRQ